MSKEQVTYCQTPVIKYIWQIPISCFEISWHSFLQFNLTFTMDTIFDTAYLKLFMHVWQTNFVLELLQLQTPGWVLGTVGSLVFPPFGSFARTPQLLWLSLCFRPYLYIAWRFWRLIDTAVGDLEGILFTVSTKPALLTSKGFAYAQLA